MTTFDPNIPQAESRVQSEPIRRNFIALNERTDELTPIVTTTSQALENPPIIGIVIGKAEKTYFEDNLYTPFAGAIVNLASSASGVSSFNTPGTFKQIIIYYKRGSGGDGELGFVESIELLVRDHSVDTAAAIINDISAQRIPGLTGDSETVPGLDNNVSPLDDSIIVCSVLVTNNGQVGTRGAINPLFETDILDIRPFLGRTPNAKALAEHIEAPTLAEAHPTAVITNNLIQTTTTLVDGYASGTTVTVINAAAFNPSILGYKPFIRFAEESSPTGATVFQTAQVQSVSGFDLLLDHKVTVGDGYTVTRGVLTLDKMTYDIVDELSDIIEYNAATGEVQLKATTSGSITLTGDVSGTTSLNTIDTVGGKTSTQIATTVDGYNAASSSNIASTLVKRDSSGNFSAGIVTASLSGNASTASQWQTTRTISLTGDVTGSANIDGSSNISISTVVQLDSIALGADTTGNYVATIAGTTNQVNVSGSGSESAAVTLSLPQSINTTANVIFNQVTANLIGNVTGDVSGTASNVTGTVAVPNGGTGIASFNTPTGSDSRLAAVSGTSAFSDILATSLGTSSTIVKRDGSGNFSASTVTANLTGNVTGNVSGTASNITGVAAIPNGGTGQTTANNAINALLPTQANFTILTSDGTNTSFGQIKDGYVAPNAAIAISKLATLPNVSSAVVSDTNGFLTTLSAVSSTEVGFLDGVTSSIQTQLNNKASIALSNLASVAINTTLVSDANYTDDLGTDAIEWKDIWVHNIRHNDSTNPHLALSTEGSNGNITLTPNGTGEVIQGRAYLNSRTRFARRSINVSGSISLLSTDHYIILDIAGSSQIITLPSGIDGMRLVIKNKSGQNHTLQCSGSDVFEGGSTTQTTALDTTIELIFAATDSSSFTINTWYILSYSSSGTVLNS